MMQAMLIKQIYHFNMKIPVQFFPIIMIILDFCASLVYLSYGDIKHGVYWIAAGVLTICVTIG